MALVKRIAALGTRMGTVVNNRPVAHMRTAGGLYGVCSSLVIRNKHPSPIVFSFLPLTLPNKSAEKNAQKSRLIGGLNRARHWELGFIIKEYYLLD